MKNLNSILQSPITVFVTGALISMFVALDPYLVNILSQYIQIDMGGRNILRQYPYELTALLLFLFLSVIFSLKLLLKRGIAAEKLFLLFYLFGLHTSALTSAGRLQFAEIVLLSFSTIFLIKSFGSDVKILLTKLDLLNILFISTILLSTINTKLTGLIDIFITSTKFLIIPVLFANLTTEKETIYYFVKCFIVLTVVSSIIAILQQIAYVGAGMVIVGAVNHETLKLMFEETSFGTMLRVPAFFGTYKPFTFFLVPSLLLIFNYVIYNSRASLRKWFPIIISVTLMFTALILTLSQDGLLALIIGIILSLVIRWSRLLIHWVSLALLAIVLVIFLGLVDDITDAVSTELHLKEPRIRLQLAKESMEGIARKHPWIGAGKINVKRYSANVHGWTAHNNFINAAEIGGIGSLLTYSCLIGYTFLNLFKVNLSVKTAEDKWILRGLLLGFICLIVMYQFHPFFLEHFTWLYMAIVQAIVIIYSKASIAHTNNLKQHIESN